jgi:hypothetical protein
MTRRMRSAVVFLAFIACGGSTEPSSTSSAATEPEWNVTTGNAACDAHLKKTCRDAAIACLSNATCNALTACYRRCDENSPDYCAIECERQNKPDWTLVNPYVSCASTEPECDR